MTDNYETDEWLMSMFNDYYDPCPLNDTPETDGLVTEWHNKTFVNPPYSKPLKWVEKAIEESKKGKLIVMLLRVDTSTKWFMKLEAANAKFLFIHGRLKHRTGKPSNFASMLVVLNG